ncbi:MAG: putative colanic acid biosynthesis acetyltransferase [Planctomycetes bacterium]|nr:putative colanic acid biosynthesis acetyltransferase [Planctomycetota bacterium]
MTAEPPVAAPDPPFRAFWWRTIGRLAFRMTPYGWFKGRRVLLRLFGAFVTPNTKVRRTTHIDRPWNVRFGDRAMIGDDVALRARAPIVLGDRCAIAQYATLSTERRDRDGTAVAPIALGDDSWVAADALILPGTTLGPGAVVGARSTVAGEVPAWTVVAGDPATPRRQRVIEPPS